MPNSSDQKLISNLIMGVVSAVVIGLLGWVATTTNTSQLGIVSLQGDMVAMRRELNEQYTLSKSREARITSVEINVTRQDGVIKRLEINDKSTNESLREIHAAIKYLQSEQAIMLMRMPRAEK